MDLEALRSTLNGSIDHDRAVLEQWLEQYRGQPEAEPLLREIGRLLFQLDEEGSTRLVRQAQEEIFDQAEQALSAAREQAACGAYEEALQTLAPAVAELDGFPLSEDCLWMDFHSLLDGLLYQDYFREEIAGREIRRHPMKPGKYLYAYGSLLIETGRAGEALKPLERLVSLDPVCPKYLFELGEAYKRTGRLRDAFETARWAISCASSNEEAARCCRDMAYCLAESGEYEDAALLCQLSLKFQASPRAEEELAWIAAKTGRSQRELDEEELLARCGRLGIPVGLSETVLENLKLLQGMIASREDKEE